MASRIQFTFSLLVLCACFSLLGFGQLLAQETRSERQSLSPVEKDLVRFEVYAAGLMEKYDTDEDGLLSVEEKKKMRHPPTREFDKDTDNMISLDELVESIRRPLAPKAVSQAEDVDARYQKYAEAIFDRYDVDENGFLSNQEREKMRRKPAESADTNGDGQLTVEELLSSITKQLAVVPKQNDGMDEIYRRLSEQVLKTSDANKNGQLDPNEIANAKWTAPWKEFDANDDGIMSRNELFTRYKSMLAKSRGLESSTKKAKNADKSGSLVRTRPIIEGFNSLSSDKARSKRKTETGRVAVELYLFRLPENLAHGSIGDVVKRIKEAEDFSNAISSTAKKCGGVDQIIFTSDFNSETTINSGAEVPVKSGGIQSRGGTTYQVTMYDVGLSTVVSCQKEGDKIAMVLNLKKSAVVESEDASDDDYTDTKIVQWTFNSKLTITGGEPEVVASASGNQNWLLVAVANEVE